MTPEARLEATEHGLVPDGEGWFVLNARDARWRHSEGSRRLLRHSRASLEFSSSGIYLDVSRAGRADGDVPLGGRSGGLPRGGRRGAADRRGRGASAATVGLRALPGRHEACDLGAGDGPLPGARGRRPRPVDGPGLGRRDTVDEAALRHGAGVEEDTTEAEQAYARFARRRPARYREGLAPG